MRDKITPHLAEGEQPSAVLSSHELLTGREAELQARLDELARELAGLEDTLPDDALVPSGTSGQSLEQLVTDSLRAVMDSLEPSRPTPSPQPEPVQPPAPAIRPRARTITWQRFAAVAALLVAMTGAIALFLLYGLPLVTEITSDEPNAATVALSTATNMPVPTTTSSPTRLPVAATLLPSPTIVAPVIRDAPGRARATVRAETLQILDVSGTLRLELPLAVMTETIQLVEGAPVLKPVLPVSGAGLHRGSAPFGQDGTTLIAAPGMIAPASLWQIRPGDRLIGCNSDGTCHDYQVVIAETWDLGQVQRVLREWRPDWGVLVYVVLDSTDVWVIQAQPQGGETR